MSASVMRSIRHITGLTKHMHSVHNGLVSTPNHYRRGLYISENRNFSRQTTEDGIIIRAGTPADEEGIIALDRLAHDPETYKTDYMPGWLHKILNEDTNRMTAVAERNGEIVGFSMLLGGIDDGQTIHGEAGRVHPDLQGKGIFHRLVYRLVADASRKWPLWKYFRDSNTRIEHFSFAKISIVLERVLYRVKLPACSVVYEHMQKDGPRTEVPRVEVSEQRFTEIISDPHLSKLLYPDGLIPMNHNIFRTMASNVPLITRYHDQILFSGDVNSGPCGISVGGRLDCDDKRAWRYNFNYSGDIDLDVFLVHLKDHLKCCAMEPPERENTYLIAMLPDNFKTVHGDDRMRNALQQHLNVSNKDITTLHQFIVEYDDLLGSMKNMTSR